MIKITIRECNFPPLYQKRNQWNAIRTILTASMQLHFLCSSLKLEIEVKLIRNDHFVIIDRYLIEAYKCLVWNWYFFCEIILNQFVSKSISDFYKIFTESMVFHITKTCHCIFFLSYSGWKKGRMIIIERHLLTFISNLKKKSTKSSTPENWIGKGLSDTSFE